MAPSGREPLYMTAANLKVSSLFYQEVCSWWQPERECIYTECMYREQGYVHGLSGTDVGKGAPSFRGEGLEKRRQRSQK